MADNIFSGSLKYPLYVSIAAGVIAGLGSLFLWEEEVAEVCFILMLSINTLFLLCLDGTYKHIFRDPLNVFLFIGFMLIVYTVVFACSFSFFSGKGCHSNGGPPKFMD